MSLHNFREYRLVRYLTKITGYQKYDFRLFLKSKVWSESEYRNWRDGTLVDSLNYGVRTKWKATEICIWRDKFVLSNSRTTIKLSSLIHCIFKLEKEVCYINHKTIQSTASESAVRRKSTRNISKLILLHGRHTLSRNWTSTNWVVKIKHSYKYLDKDSS